MSKKERVYETVALVKEIKVTSKKPKISFQPVQKFSLDQHFLCLKKKDKKGFKSLSKWANEKSTYKLFKKLQVKIGKNKQKRIMNLLQIAAIKRLPVQIQFKDKGKVFKLTKIRVIF